MVIHKIFDRDVRPLKHNHRSNCTDIMSVSLAFTRIIAENNNESDKTSMTL